MTDTQRQVAEAMQRINDAWLAGRVDDLAPLVHDEVVMVIPGFAGRIQGREPFLAGFRDFCGNATVRQFEPGEHQVDVVGDTAFVTFGYEMVYERAGQASRVTGRDLWVFARRDRAWIAVWRTMLDTLETPV